MNTFRILILIFLTRTYSFQIPISKPFSIESSPLTRFAAQPSAEVVSEPSKSPKSSPGGHSGPPSGPPPQSFLVSIVNKAFDLAFPLLYTFSRPTKSSNLESYKNLRVLWTRALLNSRKEMDDPVAYELLPRFTRGLVSRLPSQILYR